MQVDPDTEPTETSEPVVGNDAGNDDADVDVDVNQDEDEDEAEAEDEDDE